MEASGFCGAPFSANGSSWGLVFFAYGGILTFIPYAKTLGMSTETSLFFVVFAAIIVLTRPVIGRIFDQFGPDFTFIRGFCFFGAGLLLFSQIQTTTGPVRRLFLAQALAL